MKSNKLKMVVFVCGLMVLNIGIMHAQTIRYGFQQDADNPLQIMAVAIPDFSSDNVTISTAVFSFSLTSSLIISPMIEQVPASGDFIGHNGSWTAQKITPQAYRSVGFDDAELLGNDIYQVVLQNAPEISSVEAGQVIPLFSFELVTDYAEGRLEVLTNGGAVRNAIYGSLQANFNNQMSVSIDDAPSVDIYDENDPFSAKIEFPLTLVSYDDLVAKEASLMLQPNPAVSDVRVIVQSPLAGAGEIIIHDIQQREVFRQSRDFTIGMNIETLRIDDLPSGTYLLVTQLKDLKLQTKLIKINN